jgi:ubiquinone/menaquinone biosynthesis C-methylase UbiE
MPATLCPVFNYDASDVHLRYAEARHLAPHTVAMWLNAIERHVPREEVKTVIDLGCGTGRFSAALGGHFSARVIAIDPSRNMLSVAAAAANERLAFVRARADHLPLRASCADLFFASMVWHHIPEKHEAGREICRVLRPGRYLCVRTPTLEALDSELYLRFFPSAKRLNEQILPARADLISCLTDCGLALVHHSVLRHPQASSPPAYADRVALRAFSDLASISDEEFRRGMAELGRYCTAVPREQEIGVDVDLFVFRSPTR